MATEREKRQFFANRKDVYTIHMGGKRLALNNFPQEIQEKIKKRLAEKDEVIRKGLAGELPGIKIDGRKVTRDNIHEFEKGYKKEKLKKKVYTRTKLNEMTFAELREIGDKLGIKFRGKKEAIKEILASQK